MSKKKKHTFLKRCLIVFAITIMMNLVLSLISTLLPIHFVTPTSMIEAPEIFFSLSIGRYYTLNINQTIMNTWVLMILMIVLLKIGTKKLSVKDPSRMQIVLEEYYIFVEKNFLDSFGKYKKKFMPFFSALFAFLAFTNLSIFFFPFVPMFKREHGGILIKPFFRTATADINTTLGLALVVTVIFLAAAIRRAGVLGFIKELARPFFLMLPINIIGEIAKPINIAMRLFGNMFAGLVIIALLYSLSLQDILPKLTGNLLQGSFSFTLGWPMILQIYFDFFIGLLQAYVFTVLSSVYISQMLFGEE